MQVQVIKYQVAIMIQKALFTILFLCFVFNDKQVSGGFGRPWGWGSKKFWFPTTNSTDGASCEAEAATIQEQDRNYGQFTAPDGAAVSSISFLKAD